MSVDPRGMTLRDWADSIVLTIGDRYGVGRLDDESRWQDWMTTVLRPFAALSPPRPYDFLDWREFAMRVYPFLQGVE